ncbi:hypothetical protein M3A74_02275 [Corynebacterium appendicis]|uniref:hypothetical protein n=1 Tax=Corynebacterium appendicis TaxID=163202 RepID=UPI00223AFAE7|nr:hypothetical protein [Corynebacterium appendicis]MCT1683647.1 hypothetical protein [Corynebacterium appendicis]
MTVSIARSNSTDSHAAATGSRIQPADVWDLDRRRATVGGGVNVRTLEPTSRKYTPIGSRHSEAFEVQDNGFETRREKTGAAIMGALFGLALIVGSAFGGAFSGGDAGFAPQDASTQIAAVSHH